MADEGGGQGASTGDSRQEAGAGRTGHTGLAALADEDFSVYEAIGGVRGMVESVLPGLLFVVMFVATRELKWTVIASGALALVQVAIRLVTRQSFLGALTGLLSVAICLVWAWLSKDARNYYLPGFLINIFWIVLLSATVLVKVPGIGALVEYVRDPVFSGFRDWLRRWRSDRPLLKAYTIVTLMWIAVFALRLLVQVPLYLTKSVGLLGTARLIMGIPLYALAIWISWLIIATPFHHHTEELAAGREAAGQAEGEGDRAEGA